MTETEVVLRQGPPGPEAVPSRGLSVLGDISASELAGRQALAQIYIASCVPFEMSVRMRKYFRVGHRFWTLIRAA